MDNGSITLKAESFRNVGGTINAWRELLK
jgi:hypothetical protein